METRAPLERYYIGLAKPVQYVLWPTRVDPGISLQTFHSFLESHYHKVWIFSDRSEVWQRE